MILIFMDGMDGWICHNKKKVSIKRPALIEWKYKHCSPVEHSALVIINSQGKEDFIKEAGEEYDINRWQDAFDWFSLDIKCDNCGIDTKDFISFETM